MLNYVTAFTTDSNLGDNRKSTMAQKSHSTLALLAFCLCALLAFSACNRAPSPAADTPSAAAKHFNFKGKVVSIDKPGAMANIDNDPIAGYMDPMVMGYTIKPPALLDQLQAGDTITGDLIVQPDNKYWLENVKVTEHAKMDSAKPAAPEEKSGRKQ